ncbi:MAG: NAD(P)/FAD-dependent oxidoreductase [Thermodesulfobacteriota bacterium]
MKVSIAGGGPAGLITALYLSRIPGTDITVYEKQDEGTYRSSLCAEGISLEKLKRLENETGFCSTPFIAARVRGVRVNFPNRRQGIVIQDGATLKRTEWLRGMIEVLRQRKVAVRFSERYAGPDVPDDGWLIGADGPASKIRSRIGGRVEQVPAVQYRMRLDWPKDYFDVFVGSRFYGRSKAHGYGWIFPRDNGVFNVGAGGSYDILDQFLADYGISGSIEEKGAAPISVNGTVFERGRVLLVGDAAGLTNPVTCGGLCAIICCAGYLRQAVSSGQPGVYTRLIKRHGLFPADWNRRQQVFYLNDPQFNLVGDLCADRRVNPPGPAFFGRLAATPRLWKTCLRLGRHIPALKSVSW